MNSLLSLLALILLLQNADSQENPYLVVHEWGTFTSLQDESGQAIGGINTDDEPVPGFVHTVGQALQTLDLLVWPTDLPEALVKGLPHLHPDVTLRLETPVMYFYPPEGSALPLELDVRASFRGGWLTEYYPQAAVEAPGLKQQRADGGTALGGISEHTMGTLTWKNLRVGVDAAGPKTGEEVWLAPRRVRAVSVATPEGESEKYLFYRGVGHLDALLRVQRSAGGDELEIRSQPSADLPAGSMIHAWLADIRKDGSAAFRPLGPLALGSDEVLARVPSRFSEEAFSQENLAQLRASMREGLIADGLFADEAEAMLDTWEAAYFQSPGLRLFFTVPQAWTDYYLPLEFSEPVELVRVMVGRIEITTPEQRALLAQIAAGPTEPFPSEAVRAAINGNYQLFVKGKMSVEDLDVPLPENYLAYLKLGRMRNALVLNELELRPTADLQAFISTYRLSGYKVPRLEAPPELETTQSTSTLKADLPVLEDDLAAGWRAIGTQGAQVLGAKADGPVFNGEKAMAVQAHRQALFPRWSVALVPPQQLMHPGFAGLYLAFHPGDTEPPDAPALILSVDELSVDLARPSAASPLDLTRREWQVLEIPFRAFAAENDGPGAVKPVSSIRLEGNLSGTFYLDEVRLKAEMPPSSPTAVLEEQRATRPASFTLAQNYPNPFNSQTAIHFALPQAAIVELVVYNLAGQKVAQLLRGLRGPGDYTVHWDGRDQAGRDLTTGMYLYRLRTENQSVSRKLLLLR